MSNEKFFLSGSILVCLGIYDNGDQVPETCMLKAVDRSITHITAHQHCFIKLFYNFDESYMHVLIVHKYFQYPRVSHTSFFIMANWNEQENNCSKR